MPGTSYMDLFKHSSNQLLKDVYKDRIEPYQHEYPVRKYNLFFKCISHINII